MVNCIIIDDDEVQRQLIAGFVEEIDYLNLIGSYNNPVKALGILQSEQIDLILLDVEMPKMSGIDFLKSISFHGDVVLITSSETYAAKAFEFEVADYLVKPVPYSRFVKSMERLHKKKHKIEVRNKNEVFIRTNSNYQKINIDNILYIEGAVDYVKIHLPDAKYMVHSSLKKIIEILPQNEFIRIHRSYIVRLDKIDKINTYHISIGQTELPVSKANKEALLEKISTL